MDQSTYEFQDLFNESKVNADTGSFSSIVTKFATVTSNLALPYVGPNSTLFTDLVGNVVGEELNSGQFLIGATGGAPAPGTITSPVNTLAITPGPNTLAVDLAPIVEGNHEFTDLITINDLNLPGIGANKVLTTDAVNELAGQTIIDGQFLIGATGGAPAPGTITSADSSITVTPLANGIDLSAVVSPSVELVNVSPAPPVAPNTAQIYRFGGDNNVYFDNDGANDYVFRNNSGASTLARMSSTGIAAQKLSLTSATNQIVLGPGPLLMTINSAPLSGASRTYTIPDVGANSEFVMTNNSQLISGVKTFTDRIVGSQDLALGDTSDQILLGTGNVVTISASPSSSYRLTIPDTTTNANFVVTEGSTQRINTPVQFSRVISSGLPSNQIFFQNGFTGSTVTLNFAFPGASSTITFPAGSAVSTIDYNERTTTLSGAKTYSNITTISNTTNCTGVGTGALICQGGAYIAQDTRTNGQFYYGNVTSPTSGTGPGCIGSLNTANTKGPQMVCFGNSDAANSNRFSLLGPTYVHYGTLSAVTLTLAGRFYKVPMSCGLSGSVGNRWGGVNSFGGSGLGVFTCPAGMTLEIQASYTFPNSGVATTWVFAIYKNPTFAAVDANGSYEITGGTQIAQILPLPSSTTFTVQGNASSVEDCAAANTICLAAYSSSTNGAVTGTSSTRVLIRAIF